MHLLSPWPGNLGRSLVWTFKLSSSGAIYINLAIFGNGAVLDAADMLFGAL